MSLQLQEFYEFGPFQLDVHRRILSRDHQPLALPSKTFETLLFLVRNHGRVLLKDDLMKAVWPDSFVEEANLAQNVSALRKLLGESPGENRYIATIPGRGYQFVAEVHSLARGSELGAAEPSSGAGGIVIERHASARLVIEEEQVEEPAVEPALVGREKLNALAWISALVLVFAFAGGLYLMRRNRPAAPVPRELHSLAVFPFQSLDPAQGEEYLGLGVTDAVITRLSNLKQLTVRPTSAVVRYAGGRQDPRQAGRELGVESFLDGKVQKSGSRIRVTVQLVRVQDGAPLWASTFDEDFTNIFGVEDSISRKVVDALAIQLAAQEKRQLARHYTGNIEAYRYYHQGRYAEFQFTPVGLHQAIEYFNRAIQLDPSYALAYAGLADAYTTASDWTLPPREALPRAESASRKALLFDENLAEAHAALGHALMHQWKLADAGKEFERALALNPNNTAIYFSYGEYLSAAGKQQDAIAVLNKALELDPLSPEINGFLGWPLFLHRDPDGCLAAAAKTLSIYPEFWLGYLDRGMCLVQKGQFAAAIPPYQKALALNPDSTIALSGLTWAYARSGERAKAEDVLNQLHTLSQRQYVSPMDIASVHLALGEKDRAFEWMEKAYADQSEVLIWLRRDAMFDEVRADPRFENLARRVGALPSAD